MSAKTAEYKKNNIVINLSLNAVCLINWLGKMLLYKIITKYSLYIKTDSNTLGNNPLTKDELRRVFRNAIDRDSAQLKSVFTSVQQQGPDNSYVDLAVFSPRDVEEEIREIAIALVNVCPLGEDLPERLDAFFRGAVVGTTQLPVEIIDHSNIFPKLRRIRRILSRGIFQSRSLTARIDKITSGYVETSVGNVQCETIEGRFAESDDGTDTSPSRG